MSGLTIEIPGQRSSISFNQPLVTWEELEEAQVFNKTPTAPTYSTREKLGAQFTLENMIGSFAMAQSDKPYRGFTPDENFKVSEYIESLGIKDRNEEIRTFGMLHDSVSAQEADWKMAVYGKEAKARQIRDTMGTWENLWTGAFAGITDPFVLATAAAPVIKASHTAMQAAKRLGAVGIGEQAVIEVGLSANQRDRTLGESAVNTLVNGVMGGVFGGFGSTFFNAAQRAGMDRASMDSQRGLIRLGFEAEPNRPYLNKLLDPHNKGGRIETGPGGGPTPEPLFEFHNLTPAELRQEIANHTTANKSFFGRIPFMNAMSGQARVLASEHNVTHTIMMNRLGGADIYSEGNLSGTVMRGTETGSASSAVSFKEGTLQGHQMEALMTGFEGWKKVEGNEGFIKNMIDGWDRYNVEVADYMRDWSKLKETAPQWVKDAIEGTAETVGLLEGRKLYDNELMRGGFFNKLIDGVDSVDPEIKITKAKIAKQQEKMVNLQKQIDDAAATGGKPLSAGKVKKAEGRVKSIQKALDDLEKENAILGSRRALLQRHQDGDIEATRELIADLHGEESYTPQIHNKDAAYEDRTGWIATMKQAEKEGYAEHIDRLRAKGNKEYEIRKLEKEWKEIQDGIKENGDLRYEEAWTSVVDDNSAVSMGGIDRHAMGTARDKTRQLRIKQSVAKAYLQNHYNDLFMSHYTMVLPDMELRLRGMHPDSPEFKAAEAQAWLETEKNMADMPQSERIRMRDMHRKSQADIKEMQEILLNRNYGDASQGIRDWTFIVQSFLATTQLGAMLIPSLGDSAGIIAKTGLPAIKKALRPWLEVQKNAQGEAAFTAKEAVRMVGIVDRVMAQRLHALQATSEIGVNQGAGARMMGRISQHFYKLTGILWWNQGAKELAILGMMDNVLLNARNVKGMSKIQRMEMSRGGWTDEMLERLAELHSRYDAETPGALILNTGKIYEEWGNSNSTLSRQQLNEDAALADKFNNFLRRHADRAVVTPGAGDLPTLLTTHPIFRLLGIYKGFGFASINKTTIPMVQGMLAGDANMAFGFLGLTLLGTSAYMLRQTMYDREIDQNWQTLIYEGLLRGGALGLYSDGLAVSQKLTNNWVGLGDKFGLAQPSKYYARGVITDILGPASGLVESLGYSMHAATKVAAGEEITDVDRARAWRMMPYNNLFYLRTVLENY